MPFLNGIALGKAVKASDSINRHIHTISLGRFTSGKGRKSKDRMAKNIVDVVVCKDADLLENLAVNVDAYIQSRESGR